MLSFSSLIAWINDDKMYKKENKLIINHKPIIQLPIDNWAVSKASAAKRFHSELWRSIWIIPYRLSTWQLDIHSLLMEEILHHPNPNVWNPYLPYQLVSQISEQSTVPSRFHHTNLRQNKGSSHYPTQTSCILVCQDIPQNHHKISIKKWFPPI